MELHFFRKEEHAVNIWSGGQTTQLVIYPFDATLSERNFLFRISTASIEIEESEFSSFEGYNRLLMLLNGKLELVHKGHHSKTLFPFEYDEFNGSWETTSRGKGKDFNVIYGSKFKKVNVLKKDLLSEENLIVEHYDFIGVWCLSGNIEIEGKQMAERDFMLATNADKAIDIKSKEPSTVIVTGMCL